MLLALFFIGLAPALGAAPMLEVGSLHLERCRARPLTYCGRLERALDPTGALPDRIGIHFELYPHTAPGATRGTLVATEGGPGYPATESRADYLALFAPLRAHRDVLIMDNRGTGRSGALDCPALQSSSRWSVEEVGACGALLGTRAPLYSTAYAADDLAAVLEALGRTSIDLYGDSYGTYFEQVFALRHPALLHSLVLDGAYPLEGPDYAWYPSYAPAMRDKFNLACARSRACAARGGTGLEHLVPLLETLRSTPYPARALDSDGHEREFTADAAQLATVMFAGSPAYASVRELDAAGRAFLSGDRRPLERLMAETVSGVDSRDPSANPARWSAALEVAVMCQDPPQIYDMRLAPAERARARDQAIAARERTDPDAYAPFTIEEYRHMPLDYSFLDLCIDWPVSSPAHPAGQVVVPGTRYPDVPALVISGELDDITTPADGAFVARAFARGRQIVIANSFHVNALPRARSDCGAVLAQRFLASGAVGDAACAGAVPPVRLLAGFPRRVDEVEPARALPGNRADAAALSSAASAVLGLGDVLARARSNSSDQGPGLRGGRFEIIRRARGLDIRLRAVRLTEDLEVSGWLEVRGAHAPEVHARLHLQGVSNGGIAPSSGTLEVTWSEASAAPRALLRGRLDGVPLRADTVAP
ncbi:MAG TPA: alpha/beta fold hydrolase [Steroidobacteraceae bacterium]|nr:alpha/beta fold hydrolase [Steroidobacteraceae bacterium]